MISAINSMLLSLVLLITGVCACMALAWFFPPSSAEHFCPAEGWGELDEWGNLPIAPVVSKVLPSGIITPITDERELDQWLN